MSVGGYFRFDQKLHLVMYLLVDCGMVDKAIAFAHGKLHRVIAASMVTRAKIGAKVSGSQVIETFWVHNQTNRDRGRISPDPSYQQVASHPQCGRSPKTVQHCGR